MQPINMKRNATMGVLHPPQGLIQTEPISLLAKSQTSTKLSSLIKSKFTRASTTAKEKLNMLKTFISTKSYITT